MYKRILVILTFLIILLNISAWTIPGLCDWYTTYVTPIWLNTFARITGVFPFSVGEIMLVIAVILILAMVVTGVFMIFLHKKNGFKKHVFRFYRIFVAIAVGVCLIMTLNCTMLYHCTPLDANPDVPYRDYSIEELEIMRNHIVYMCNQYSARMERDENGYLVYEGDMQETAKKALHNISDRYPKLAGYYPDVKHMMFSGFMSQAYMAGYYFPFSLEANCNDKMYISNYPGVYCHELSHLHGYIYEDEANFLAFLACIESGDDFFIYCGYLSVLNYIDNAYWESIEGDIVRYTSQPQVSETVHTDNVFLLPETWDMVEENAVFSTDALDAASDEFTEASLQLNGVKEGIASYGQVVGLLLRYYDGTLY